MRDKELEIELANALSVPFDEPVKVFDSVAGKKGQAKFILSRHAEEILRCVLTKKEKACVGSIKIEIQCEMASHEAQALIEGYILFVFTLKDPRIPYGGAPDHYTIAICIRLYSRYICNCANIPIADHWNFYQLLDLGNCIPIGFSLVSLGACAPVDSDKACSAIFQDARNFLIVAGIIIPTKPDFSSNRDLGSSVDSR